MVAAQVIGVGSYAPERRLDNAELSRTVETSDAWIRERTGIGERRIAAPDEAASDLATAAAKRALAVAGLQPNDIDMVMVATVTGDRPLPATAAIVQRKLGITNRCGAFDLAAACAGFVYGLGLGNALIGQGQCRHVLVIGVEVLSRFVNWEDRTTCVLFGDGAGAVVLGPGAAEAPAGIDGVHLHCQGSMSHLLTIPAGGSEKPASGASLAEREHYVRMEGQDVFRVAVKELASACLSAIDALQMTASDVDWVVAHQANERILEAVAQRSGIPFERFFRNIARYGNTSSASIPLALDEAYRSGSLEPGSKLVLCALGAGIAWGSCVLRWQLPKPTPQPTRQRGESPSESVA